MTELNCRVQEKYHYCCVCRKPLKNREFAHDICADRMSHKQWEFLQNIEDERVEE